MSYQIKLDNFFRQRAESLHDQLNLDIVFSDKKQLKELIEIFDGSSEFGYATDVADYVLKLNQDYSL